MPRLRRRVVAAAIALIAVGPAAVTTAAQTAAGPTPARPVPHRFGLGVQAGSDAAGINGWMPATHVPWDYAYRYIGGGLNTSKGKNWTDWAPNASFPIRYAQDARAHHYTPVLTYYTIHAAHGPCLLNCSEAQTDLTNLNSPSVMRLFFQDFTTLMKRLGPHSYGGVQGFGHDVIVHVEPDLSGYAELAVRDPQNHCFGFCVHAGNDPSLLHVAVAASQYPPLHGYPNTYRGFNLALLRIRDVYAPNVRLAFHVSDWATGTDVNSATSPQIDATRLGTLAGQFAARAGVRQIARGTSTYDLIFNDVSNKDAAYYTNVLGKPRFWDQANRTFPDFHRWESYVSAASTAAGRPVIVWQIPIGNQLLRSENNTVGHYQDNRVQYFLSHVRELARAHVVGLLFGAATAQATSNVDTQADGVTNPPIVCNSDGWSTGRIVCTSQVATVADDDGGYLRARARAYYRAPLAL